MKTLAEVKQLGETVRRVRKNQRLTQEQLAAACGVGTRFIRELEKGKESCHLGKALHVADMLGISILIEAGGK